MPEPESVADHVILAGSGCDVDGPGRASPVRRLGFGALAFGAVRSMITVLATIGPAGPVASEAPVTAPAFRYRPTEPVEQPVTAIVYEAPLPTGAPTTQSGADPVRVKSPTVRPVTGPA